RQALSDVLNGERWQGLRQRGERLEQVMRIEAQKALAEPLGLIALPGRQRRVRRQDKENIALTQLLPAAMNLRQLFVAAHALGAWRHTASPRAYVLHFSRLQYESQHA